MSTAQTAPTIVILDPASILVDDNIRFNLKPTRINQLAELIGEAQEVLAPIEVEPYTTEDKAIKYRLTSGFYRVAAVNLLHTQHKIDIPLPAIVRETSDEIERLKHQLMENDRESMSPMDKATAIKKLVVAGVKKVEIRRMFASAGGRKGNEVKPLSNSMLNIYMRLLDLPKGLQDKIHAGILGVGAAYELGKADPTKRAAIVEKEEAAYLASLEREEKDEQKLLDQESKLLKAQDEVKTSVDAIESAKAEVMSADLKVTEMTAALRKVQKEPWGEKDEKEKRDLTERLKAAETDLKGAQKIAKDTKNMVAKLSEKAEAAKLQAQKRAEALEAARKAPKAPNGAKEEKPKVTAKAIKAAAGGAVPLSLSDIREALKDFDKDGVPPKTAQIGKVFRDCFNGVSTTKELILMVGVVVGEAKLPTIAKQKR